MPKNKILLIEDDSDLSFLYKNALEKAGFEVQTCSNGMEGISKSLKTEVDLILLDLMMPMADGKDVLSMLNLNKKTANIPIIIISNLNPGTFDLSGVDDQIIDYWIKSDISPKTLASKIVSYFS